MTILKLFIASLLVSQIFAGQGADVSCSASACTSCPTAPSAPGTLSWVTSNGKCAINNCPGSTSSGITGASDLFCQSCPGASASAVFANTGLTACVAATATCGNTRTANTWTNTDCLACNGNSLQYAKADRSGCQANPIPGADVSCSTSICSSCPTAPSAPGTLSWQAGSTNGKCAINTCPASTSSGITGASDLFCQSCPGASATAVFANTGLTGCVAATATCGNTRTANTWTNADCLACNGNSLQYAKADRSGCQANPIPGADVSCSTSICSSCPTAPSAPGTLSWQAGSTNGKCAINSCPASTSSGITGASDLFCQSCPGASATAVFANTGLTGCVAATATCGNTRTANTWTNADCLACNGNSLQYAKADRSGCQANPIPGADVSCSTSTCSSCPTAPSAPGTLSWQTGSTNGKCAINTCPASTSSGITGASDLFCQSCPGASATAVFANTGLTGCVAATATCGNTRTANTWTNADCLACNGSTLQYAKTDRSGCQATAPSSSSSTNSMIILSSVLFLISFLF